MHLQAVIILILKQTISFSTGWPLFNVCQCQTKYCVRVVGKNIHFVSRQKWIICLPLSRKAHTTEHVVLPPSSGIFFLWMVTIKWHNPTTCWERLRVHTGVICKAEQTLTTWHIAVWMPRVDTQVQSLLGSYSAIILPCHRANHPGSPPTIHQCLEDGACRVLAAVVELSQSVRVYASLHRRGRGRALRRTHWAGLLPLLRQDNKRIYL